MHKQRYRCEATSCAVNWLQGPPRRAEWKGVKRSRYICVVANPVLSAKGQRQEMLETTSLFICTFGSNLFVGKKCANKKIWRLRLLPQFFCKGPRGKRNGKALNGADIICVVVNPVLSANEKRSKRVSNNFDTFYFSAIRTQIYL